MDTFSSDSEPEFPSIADSILPTPMNKHKSKTYLKAQGYVFASYCHPKNLKVEALTLTIN